MPDLWLTCDHFVRKGGRGEKGARDKVTKRRRGKEGVEQGKERDIAREGCTCVGGPRVPSYATADGAAGLPA